jgi:hypothetical protein
MDYEANLHLYSCRRFDDCYSALPHSQHNSLYNLDDEWNLTLVEPVRCKARNVELGIMEGSVECSFETWLKFYENGIRVVHHLRTCS